MWTWISSATTRNNKDGSIENDFSIAFSDTHIIVAYFPTALLDIQ